MERDKPKRSSVRAFLWQRRIWWLGPILLSLAMIGVLLLIGDGTSISPFSYNLF